MKTLADFYRLFPNRPALAEQPASPAPVPALDASRAPASIKVAPRYRERDYGTGYGRSSGYARASSYAASHDGQLLRVC
jgi:hypothetical protein